MINDMGDAICDDGNFIPKPRPIPGVVPKPDNPCLTNPEKCKPVKPAPIDICKLFPDMCKGPVDPKPIGPPPELCIPPTGCQLEATPGNFMKVLGDANCGCTIRLSPGSYPKFTYNKKCTPANPLVLTANGAGVKFNQGFSMRGNGGLFNGLEVGGGMIDFQYANDNRITRFYFSGPSRILIAVGSSRNRIDHNDIIVPGEVGTGPDSGNFIALDAFWSAADGIYENRIDSNFFQTTSSTKKEYQTGIFHGINTGACMRRGFAYVDTPWVYHRTTIENNLFQNWNRRRVFEIKGSGVVIKNNSIVNCNANSLYRHGKDGVITGNYFENSPPGLSIREYNHRIENNILIKSKFELYAGSRKYNQCGGMCFKTRPWFPSGIPQGAPAVKTYLNNNRGALVVGEIAGDGCIVPTTDTTIACHEGGVTKKVEVGTKGPSSTSCTVTARKLTREEVGRGAPPDCPAPPP